jgi:4-hydroxy-tetrahydrodipicolinate synthase
MIRPEGSWVAIVTPFTETGEIDFAGFESLVDFQAQNGTSGLLLMGSTGEPTLLTMDEKREILERVIPYAMGKIPVFAGTTCGTTRETVGLTRHAAKVGADGIMLVVPPYVRPPQDAIYEHFKTVAEAVDIPIAIYNNPTRVGVNIDPPTMIRLAEIPNIVADKEAMGNVSQIAEILKAAGEKVNVLCCDAPNYALIVPTLALGGHGTANVTGNVIPQEMAEMSEPWRSWEDVKRTRELYYRFMPLMSAIYSVSNPVPVKAALRLLGRPAGPTRKPLPEMHEDKLRQLDGLLESLGVKARYKLS